MPLNCDWFAKLCSGELCNLKLVAYISGCIGLIWRIILTGFLSKLISGFEDDLKIILIFFGILLAYILLSIIANSLFVWGTFKEKRYFILPYIITVALEMSIGLLIISGVIMLLFATHLIGTAFLGLFVTIFCIGISFLLWLYNILYYKELEEQEVATTAKKRNVSMPEIRQPLSW